MIRYNLVPTRVLLEICNLGNPKDRALMKTAKYRQRVAETIYEGVAGFFEDRQDAKPAVVAAGVGR